MTVEELTKRQNELTRATNIYKQIKVLENLCSFFKDEALRITGTTALLDEIVKQLVTVFNPQQIKHLLIEAVDAKSHALIAELVKALAEMP